ncbi:hypothetical protein BAE44_0011075 [Dichanthelium oligosanthes]|uniref:F-box domain-containing protein n=1 Tax=Dichanthelium oligosanthes TaxID=888268 RepID=A0A1E5VS16_9POAL|nr:hypothetical protein BAE44_0011075 [Dichanthelium oligosanthes]
MDGAAGDGGVDRISDLPDDLLHVILSHLRNALDVTRTAALSRRWRRVWVHARDLSLVDVDPEYLIKGISSDEFVGFVDWVLARRGDADMDSLQISMELGECPSSDKINEWIRYGTRRVVADFYLRIPFSNKALTALTLYEVSFAEDKEGRALRDFVSSCCPRLRTLVMEKHLELRVIFPSDLLTLDVQDSSAKAAGD